MFGRTWRVGRIAGVAISIDVSWTIIFVWVTWSLFDYLQDIYEGLTPATALALAVTASLLFFASVLTHEMAHAIVAKRRGIPVQGITLFLFGGATHAVVEARGAKAELVVSAVGPLTSLALAGLFGAAGIYGQDVLPIEVAGTLGYLGWVNLVLAIFNLLPGFPLDGGRVLRAIVWGATGSLDRATRVAAIAGQTVGFLMIGLGVLIGVTQSVISGVWLAAIGWFLAQAARTSYAQQQLQSLLGSAQVEEVMSPPDGEVRTETDATVGRDDSMREVLPLLEGGKRRRVLVLDGDEVVGVIAPRDLVRWLRSQDALEA